MAGRGPQALDRWIAPVEIVAGANALRIFNGLTEQTITVPPGQYWCHGDDSVAVATDYPGLYTTISDLLLTSIFDGAALQAWSPYQRRPGCGLQIVGGLHALLFSSPLFTLPKDLLGWPAGWSVDTPQATITRSPQTARGVWVSPEGAWDKRSWVTRTLYHGAEQTERSDAYQLDWGSRRVRTLQYSWLPAALVHKQRALLPEYARTGQILAGDTAAAYEWMWESLSKLEDIIIVHDEGASCGHAVAAHPWEAVRIATLEACARYEQLARLLSTGGEQYELTIPVVHLGGSYEQ